MIDRRVRIAGRTDHAAIVEGLIVVPGQGERIAEPRLLRIGMRFAVCDCPKNVIISLGIVLAERDGDLRAAT